MSNLSKWEKVEPTLTDFMDMEVVRKDGEAYIIFDTIDGSPVRLIGFSTDPSSTDYEIREDAFHHYQMLRERFAR